MENTTGYNLQLMKYLSICVQDWMQVCQVVVATRQRSQQSNCSVRVFASDIEWCEKHPYKYGYDWLADPNGTEPYNCYTSEPVIAGNLTYTNSTYNEGLLSASI